MRRGMTLKTAFQRLQFALALFFCLIFVVDGVFAADGSSIADGSSTAEGSSTADGSSPAKSSSTAKGSSIADGSTTDNNSFYGSLHFFIGHVDGVSGVNANSYSSRLGVRGVNTLNKTWLLTHRLEFELNTLNDADKGGGIRKLPSGLELKDNEDSDLDLREAWIGFKSAKTGIGEFRIGRHESLYDIVDDGQNLLSKTGQALPGFGQRTQQLLYVNRSAHVAYALAYAPFENKAKNRVFSGLLNYAKGPYYAGLAMEKASGESVGAKISLGLDQDLSDSFSDNVRLGLIYDKQMGSGAKSLTVTGRLSVEKYYLAAELGKVLDGDILNSDGSIRFAEDVRNRALELGYQWDRRTRFYIDYANLGDRKETSVAVNYRF